MTAPPDKCTLLLFLVETIHIIAILKQSEWMACMAHPPRHLGNHWVYFFPEFVYF